MDHPTSRADLVMRVGGVVTAVGLVATVDRHHPPRPARRSPLPSAMWFLSMLTGVGLAIVIAGLTMSARARRRVR